MTLTYTNRTITDIAGVEISYNGVTFPPALKMSVQVTPVMDRAKRTNKYRSVRIRVEGVWNEIDSPTNLQFQKDVYTAIFKQLTRSGHELKIWGKGIGDFTSNFLSNIVWGPHPVMLSWKPLHDNTCFFIWEVELTGSNCGTTTDEGTTSAIAEFNWGVTFGIDKNGMTTRTISGYLQILNKRGTSGGNSVVFSVDTYRDNISYPRLDNFHRTTDWVENPNNQEMNFRVVDTEIPSDVPFHPGMVDMKVTETMSGALTEGGLIMWKYVIRGEITIAAGLPRVLAWLAFLAVVQDRMEQHNQHGQTTSPDGKTKDIELILPHFEFRNEIYGRSLGFTVGYTIICGLDKILQASGIWRPVPGSNWQLWSTSMSALQGNRGSARLSKTASDDLIVDLCTPVLTSPGGGSNIPGLNFGTQSILDPVCKEVWLGFINQIRLSSDSDTIRGTPYIPGTGNAGINIEGEEVTGGTGGAFRQPGATSRVIIQDRGEEENYIIMEGYASRIKGKIKIPRIVSIGGVPVQHDSQEITPNTLVKYTTNGCPIYMAKWKRVYHVPSGVDGKVIDVQNIPNEFRT
jgi:hypothetical protein